jgi:hypothetical protein
MKQLLRYLKNTQSYALTLGGKNTLTLKGFCDSGFASDPDTSRSPGGYG